jgi:hypothetical protein
MVSGRKLELFQSTVSPVAFRHGSHLPAEVRTRCIPIRCRFVEMTDS